MNNVNRGATVKVNCKNCGNPFDARVADRKRGWGRFCDKSCKALHQEKRTHQMRDYVECKQYAQRGNFIYGAAEDGK